MLRTKIVCTLGPATSSAEIIREMVEVGMNVARINLSHGSYDEHRERISRVREAARELGKPVGILADLAGPKIRVGDLPEPIELVNDAEVRMAHEGRATGDVIPVTYEHLAVDLSRGDRVLLDDGLLELECMDTSGDSVTFRVVRGGLLKPKKGLNMPGVALQAPSLTEKDLRDLEFALEEQVEFVGLSFVRTALDVVDLKERIQGRALVVAKIEMAKALEDLEGIIAVTDMVMVARGDLGVELPFEQVPLAQKRIVQLSNFYCRPVITATQMLESMIEHPLPTRAEASDVANAIIDGTDAVMLSGETTVGKYPLKALAAMTRIASEIESSGVLTAGPSYDTQFIGGDGEERGGATVREHAVAAASVDSAHLLDAPAIIVITRSGFSARLVSSYRPGAPVFAVTTDDFTYRQMAVVWGVRPIVAKQEEVSYESLTDFGRSAVMESEAGQKGESVVVTAGYPFHTSGSTNTMRVEVL
jgi:pyruvate kinase